MNKIEREFLRDVRAAVDDWEYSYDCRHENGEFQVNIYIEEDDEDWDPDEVWDSIQEAIEDWDADMDSSWNEFYVCLH